MKVIHKIVKDAIKEDIGKGDITTKLCIDRLSRLNAEIIVKESGVLSGIHIAELVFKSLNHKCKFIKKIKDGMYVNKGDVVAFISGNSRAILTGERVALNFLGHLSGIATFTRKFVDEVKPYRVKIYDTRKTLPCLRYLEKYAVRCGGGYNHRMDLSSMILIKDNHWKIIGKIEKLKNYRNYEKLGKIEIEVQNLKQLIEVIRLKPDIIMLDNMDFPTLKKAIKIIRKKSKNTEIEISGGVTLKNVRRFAKLEVDRISIGEITHSAHSLDFSLEVL